MSLPRNVSRSFILARRACSPYCQLRCSAFGASALPRAHCLARVALLVDSTLLLNKKPILRSAHIFIRAAILIRTRRKEAMSRGDSLRCFGMRLAVPLLEGCVDDARALVNGIHERVEAEAPTDELFLNLLGTASLRGRKVVVFGAYKIRSPHDEAIRHLAAHGPPGVRRLASSVERLAPKQALKDCLDLTTQEVRGGAWYWGESGEEVNVWQAIAQEDRAWQYIGATPRSRDDELALVTKSLQELEARHGGSDPKAWQWGPETSCADVFEADKAARQHRALKAQLAAMQDCVAASSSARSRSPRR